MHELIQIWKKNASETNLKALNPIIGSFSVKVRVNLLIAYVPFTCGARRRFFMRHSRTWHPIRWIIMTDFFSALLWQTRKLLWWESPPLPPPPLFSHLHVQCSGSSPECNRRELFTESWWSTDAVCRPSLFMLSAKVGEKRREGKKRKGFKYLITCTNCRRSIAAQDSSKRLNDLKG